MDATETLMDLRAAARLVGLTPAALRERLRRGGDVPPHIRLGPKTIRIEATEFLAWVESHRVPGGNAENAKGQVKIGTPRASHPRRQSTSRSTGMLDESAADRTEISVSARSRRRKQVRAAR